MVSLTLQPVVQLLLLCATVVRAVEYTVIAFPPQGAQSVVVSVDGQNYPLTARQDIPNLYTGTASAPAESYNYAILDGQGSVLVSESIQRRLATSDSSGNEFFNRTTLHQVPPLVQAYHPIYPRKLLNN